MQAGRIRVVLDTNIIISAAISEDGTPAEIFEFLLMRKIINYTSKEIIAELEDVIERPAFKEHISAEYRKFIVESFKQNSIIIKPAFNEKAVLNDEKDNKFVNCALTSKAIIISGDKHLLELKKYKEIIILSAKEFLDKFAKKSK